jgi:hypothetical protein
VCTRCRQRVRVYELPRQFIDPSLYVCGDCLKPKAGQPELALEERTETVQYNPSMSEMPF